MKSNTLGDKDDGRNELKTIVDLWDKNYKNMATSKDSIRDTYVVGVMNVYYDELMEKVDNGLQ